MRQVMVRYKVKPDRAEENEQLVRAVYEELAATAPPALRYATFRLDDGVSFVHIATVEGAHNALADVRDRCEEPPVVTELHEVGSYRS